MFNVGGGEVLVILLVALIVLGPQKLPEAARQVGNVARELRRMSTSFQSELRTALDDPVEEAARERGRKVVSSEQQPAPESSAPAATADETKPPTGDADSPSSTSDGHDVGDSTSATAAGASVAEPVDATESQADPTVSTAEAAGMYDVETPAAPAAPPEPTKSAAEEAGLYDLAAGDGGAGDSTPAGHGDADSAR